MAERWEDLQCQGLKILQDDDLYSFTSDAVILANFVRLKPNETAVEIGGGSGVISILLSAKNSFKKIKMFEIQEKMQKNKEKNIIFNNLSDKIELICDDVKNFKKYFEVGSVDVVFSNPPYFEVSKFSQNSVKKVAKEEVCLNLTDLISCAKNLLKFGYLCCIIIKRDCTRYALKREVAIHRDREFPPSMSDFKPGGFITRK